MGGTTSSLKAVEISLQVGGSGLYNWRAFADVLTCGLGLVAGWAGVSVPHPEGPFINCRDHCWWLPSRDLLSGASG